MKSKAVASILRHVASKIPSLDANGEPVAAAEPQDKEAKRAARKARQQAQEEGLPEPAAAAAAAPGADGEAPVASNNEEEKLEHLYETIAWPLGKTFGHPYDAFKAALTYVSPILLK